MCSYISKKKNIELSAIFVISFVNILVNFNNTSNISNVSHKTKSPFCCIVVAPNQPENQVCFQIFVKYLLTYLISQIFQCCRQYISTRRKILNNLPFLSFLLWMFLVNFNNTSYISNVPHKKYPLCCMIVAPNQPKSRFGFNLKT